MDRLSRLTAGLGATEVRANGAACSGCRSGPADIVDDGDCRSDEFTDRMFEAINGMLLDMLAAVARKDYDDRRRRQAQGMRRPRLTASTGAARRTPSAMPGSPAVARWRVLVLDPAGRGCCRATVWKVHKRIAAPEAATH